MTLHETASGADWVFYLWNSRADAPALQRVLQTQRLALAREAAFRNRVVHLWHAEHDRSLIEGGAYGIASVRGIREAKNSEQAATRYLSEYDGHHTTSGSHGVANGGSR